MEDLDALQQDFEKLLSTCAVRNRLLRSEVESIDRVEEKREKKGKFIEKVVALINLNITTITSYNSLFTRSNH